MFGGIPMQPRFQTGKPQMTILVLVVITDGATFPAHQEGIRAYKRAGINLHEHWFVLGCLLSLVLPTQIQVQELCF